MNLIVRGTNLDVLLPGADPGRNLDLRRGSETGCIHETLKCIILFYSFQIRLIVQSRQMLILLSKNKAGIWSECDTNDVQNNLLPLKLTKVVTQQQNQVVVETHLIINGSSSQ